MYATMHAVEYYTIRVEDLPGVAYQTLTDLFDEKINLLAFSVVPIQQDQCEITLFPESVERLLGAAKKRKHELTGPKRAFLIQGDDQLGALMEIHKKLAEAGINIHSSSGVTDGRGGYGYTLFVETDDYQRAAQVLGI